jgi:hypothetical protein
VLLCVCVCVCVCVCLGVLVCSLQELWMLSCYVLIMVYLIALTCREILLVCSYVEDAAM